MVSPERPEPALARTGSEKVIAATNTHSTVSGELRRRRAASYRCPTLADGRRDPIDPPRTRPAVTARAIGRNTVEFTGCDRAVFAAITTLCARYQRAPKGGAWLVQQEAAEDVIALLETRGYRIEVTL